MDWLERLKSEDWTPRDQRKRTVEQQKEDWLLFINKRNDYMVTYGTESGQRVLIDLIENAYILKPFDVYNAQIYAMEGQRREVLKILSHVPELAGIAIFKLCKQVEEQLKKRQDDMKKQLDELMR